MVPIIQNYFFLWINQAVVPLKGQSEIMKNLKGQSEIYETVHASSSQKPSFLSLVSAANLQLIQLRLPMQNNSNEVYWFVKKESNSKLQTNQKLRQPQKKWLYQHGCNKPRLCNSGRKAAKNGHQLMNRNIKPMIPTSIYFDTNSSSKYGSFIIKLKRLTSNNQKHAMDINKGITTVIS